MWSIVFGWWIAAVYLMICLLFLAPLYAVGALGALATRKRTGRGVQSKANKLFEGLKRAKDYIKVMINLSWYIVWPFGKYLTLFNF